MQFMDLTESELCKPVDDLNPVRLDSLLQLALRTSSSATDPYKDNVGVQLFQNGIEDQLFTILSIQTPAEMYLVSVTLRLCVCRCSMFLKLILEVIRLVEAFWQ